MAAAALSVRGLATALVLLRGALIRTGIGALVVGAGELIYQFGRLVGSGGGFGNALSLLGDVASEVWERIKTGGRALALALQSVWAGIEAGWLSVLQRIQTAWADLLHRLARGLDDVPGLEETMLEVHGAAVVAGSGVYELAYAVGEADKRADALAASAAKAARAAVAPLTSLAALKGAAAEAGETSETALQRAAASANAMRAAAAEAAEAANATTPAVAELAEASKSGWDQAREGLTTYATDAMALGKNLGETLVDAFRSAEDAFAEFVRGGKVEFRSLVSSMLVDLARVAAQRFIFGPISGALSAGIGRLGQSIAGLFGGGSAGLALPATAMGGLYHRGGLVGDGTAPLRLAPAAAFSRAQRYHDGGVAGLRPDEVPAILQRGERVLSRRDTAAYDRDRGVGGVNVTIVARDAESFRQSRTQVAADIARAVSLGRRGL
jgi:hypothetical protein